MTSKNRSKVNSYARPWRACAPCPLWAGLLNTELRVGSWKATCRLCPAIRKGCALTMTSKVNNLEMLMKPNPNPCIGSSFDDFLREEGILEEVERAALRKVAAALGQQRRQGLPRSFPPSAWRTRSGFRLQRAGLADVGADTPNEAGGKEAAHADDSPA